MARLVAGSSVGCKVCSCSLDDDDGGGVISIVGTLVGQALKVDEDGGRAAKISSRDAEVTAISASKWAVGTFQGRNDSLARSNTFC